MDEDIEDLVGEVKYTDSQKSVATSNVYSMDFTDSSSEKYNSSGKATYIVEWDDSEDSDQAYMLNEKQSIINLRDKTESAVKVSRCMDIQYETINKLSKATSASFHKCSIAQEIFTQTSKTIIELAETEIGIRKTADNQNLETQTSFISVSENKTVEYKIQVCGARSNFTNNDQGDLGDGYNNQCNITGNEILSMTLDDDSSKFPVSESENERADDCKSQSSNDKIITVVNDIESQENITNETKDESKYDHNSSFEKSDTDMDEDSLVCYEYNQNKNYSADTTSDTSEVLKSVDSDLEDLYNKISEKIMKSQERPRELDSQRFGTLSPLTEESAMNSLIEIVPDCNNKLDSRDDEKYVLFSNNAGIKIKMLPYDDNTTETEKLKLPPINNNQSCPSSPPFVLFSGIAQQPKGKGQRQWSNGDRWELGNKDLAAGESPLISGRSDPVRSITKPVQLPPIHPETQITRPKVKADELKNVFHIKKDITISRRQESISIQDKITELKMNNNNVKHWVQPKYCVSTPESKTSRSGSPGSGSPDDARLGDVAERGCDALCQELLRRLRSTSWFEVSETLEEIPKVLEKYWCVISEHRIAELIRQVSCHVESPRTQVARSACGTLAAILKNTNYTKKPDFYEAVTTLLVKTGSFSRPVRRAANVALDGIVCGVELAHAVTALCVHGVGHKSPLVRCAAARLLVVCCALAGGGRELLRTRPPSAVCARRHALRALSALLEDKNTDTRKYAERLFSMLRPLSNFEAFFLTDVEVEDASRQMKKYDHILLCGPPKDPR